MFETLTTADWWVYCFFSAVFLAIYFSVSKIFAHSLNPFLYGFVANLSGFIFSVILFFLIYDDMSIFKISPLYVGLPVLMGLAFVITDLGFLKSYTAGYKVSFVVPFVRTMLIFALVVIGVVFLGESLSALDAFGLALSIVGIKLIYSQ